MPSPAPMYLDARDLDQFRQACPGVALLYHPTKDDADEQKSRVTEDFLESGLVDGVELLNGSILLNGANIDITRRALAMFARARRKGRLVAPIGASDAHQAGVVGSAITEFETREPALIFAAIRTGNTKMRPVAEAVQRKVDRLLAESGVCARYIS